MKNMVLLTAALIVAILALASPATAGVPQMINYQGQLTNSSGDPLDTTVSMVFTIYDDSTGGTSKWMETHPTVTVTGGLFNVTLGTTVPIDDSVFNQSDRWLGIAVGGDPELAPRNRLVTSPYSHRVGTIDGASGGIITGEFGIAGDEGAGRGVGRWNVGGYSTSTSFIWNDPPGSSPWPGYLVIRDGSALTPTIEFDGPNAKARIGRGCTNPGAYAFAVGKDNTANGDYSTVSGGEQNEATANHSTVGGGYSNYVRLNGHIGTIGGGGYNDISSGVFSTIGGGDTNVIKGSFSTIAGGDSNIIVGNHGTIGGGYEDSVEGNYSTIGGGYGNRGNANYVTIGGGKRNRTFGNYATIGGGDTNSVELNAWWGTIGGGYGNAVHWDYGTIGGGDTNRVKAGGTWGTVGGGSRNEVTDSAGAILGGTRNTVNASWSCIGGGDTNWTTGRYSTIPGGYLNVADGDYSFAAGRQAKAEDDGSFVWADNTTGYFDSERPNQFRVRANGGVNIVGAPTITAVAHLRVDGSISIFNSLGSPPNGNTSLFFGQENVIDPATTPGEWGIQYWPASVAPRGGGLNFWKPFGSGGGGFANNILFLDDNHNVGIKTYTPQTILHIGGDNTDVGAFPVYTAPTNINLIGTPVDEAALQGLLFNCYTRNSDNFRRYGDIVSLGYANVGTPAGGSVIRFLTNDHLTSTGIAVERMRIERNGFVGIGTASPAYPLEVSGSVMMENAAAPSASAGHSGVYSSGGELFALDAAGNSTQLSPHDPATGEWIFYSKNVKTGRVVKVDMEKLVRKIEEITGESFLMESWEKE